ncbi:hypothetical protein niasHS_003413 [Heterodera schachtii]|uniref:Uncharacterized protein n=1 Tax=Heterodera schachtii TaxID=97005 RepID=A0ABD2KGW5_HETSC
MVENCHPNNGMEKPMNVDTAAQITVITTDSWQKLGKPKLGKTTIAVKNCNEKAFAIKGKFKCQVSYNGRTSKLIAYVSGEIHQDLLGMPWIEELEIISKELMFPNSSPIINSVPTKHKKIPPVNLKNFGNFHDKKNGVKPTKFQNGEPVFVWNLKGNKANWLPATIIERVGNSPTYRVDVPTLRCAVHRLANQIRRRFPVELETPQIGQPNGNDLPGDLTNVVVNTQHLALIINYYNSLSFVVTVNLNLSLQAGIGRTGTLVALGIAYDTLQRGQRLNILALARNLRQHRAQSVQTPDQYLYIYFVILRYAQNKAAKLNIDERALTTFLREMEERMTRT